MSAAQSLPASLSEAVGRYRVGRQLAVGGMGTIYVAFDALMRREVAYKRLKVSNESARPRLTALFEREYNALRQLKHPSIVEVYDYGLDVAGPFYTMELLAGQDLATAAPLALSEACLLVRDVASALALLHARRLVHRDVTPANVRLTQDGRAKLIDFGALSEFGVAKEIVGTPSFIAPECLSGEPLDARTDLFALGGVAYWALTKRHAYPARSIGELMDAWEVPFAPASQHNPSLPKEMDELLSSLLERDPVARPQSAAHVIERLAAIGNLAPEPDAQRVAHSYLMHPPLVGRTAALDQLRGFAAEAATGQGRTALVESGPGLGRTALLDQIAVDAQLAGANVLRFQPSGRRDAGLAQSVVRFMRALFPELASEQLARAPFLARETRSPLRAVESAGDVTQQRSRLVSAIQACIEEMSQRGPLTILVDDVHRADPESLSLLASLARVTSKHAVLLIVSQEERAQGSDPSALSDLQTVATRLPLKPLSERDVDALVQTVFGDVANAHRLAHYLHIQSGGNPGQCMDLCRLLLQQNEIRYALGRFVLPFDPRGDVLGVGAALELTRLADLDDNARSLVRLLCLHDSALSAAQAASGTALALDQLFAAIEQLSARGLVYVQGEDISLASESLRHALRASLTKSELKTLHLALGQSLASHGDGSLESKLVACHHLLSGDREDDAIALVWGPLSRFELPNGSCGGCAPVLERLLAVMRKRGHPDEHLTPLFTPLVTAGFWGDAGALQRNREPALLALSNLTGMALAKSLAPKLGKRLALIVGIMVGIVRFLRTPKQFRGASYGDGVQRFVSAVGLSTAAAAAAFEPETALRVVGLLDPMEAMKEHSQGRVTRDFALGNASVISGQLARAAELYTSVMRHLDTPPLLFDDAARKTLYDGSVHGCAQAEVSSGSPHALQMAEDLGRRQPFFRPHAEILKMSYYGYRGDKELADFHRKQGEMYALQGGLSWSAFTVMSFRSAYSAMVAQDTLAVMQASVELERLAPFAPNLLLYRDLCLAYVSLARGEAEAALHTYERIAALPNAHLMPAWHVDRTFHAEALARVGRLEEAKRICEETIAVRRSQGAPDFTVSVAIQMLALIEAKLGNTARAKQLLGALEVVVAASEAPLPIGAVHREQARVALMERDALAFDQHFAAMLAAFRTTKNPALIQQCRKLLAEAERTGVLATPSWERHELVAPANTQELTSQAPDVTEMVEL